MIVKTDSQIAYRNLIRKLEKFGLTFRTLSQWTDSTHIVEIEKIDLLDIEIVDIELFDFSESIIDKNQDE